MKKRYIVAPILAGTLAVSGYATAKIKLLQAENTKLKAEIEKTPKKEVVEVEYKKTVDDIKEINEKNIDLIVYESDLTNYKLDSEDERLLGIDAHADAKFKYTVTIDLSKRDITQAGDKIMVHISTNDIKLKDVTINKPNIKYDTNIVTSLYGNRIIETETSILSELYNGIDREVKKDYNLNKEKFKLNLLNKLNDLYDCEDVLIVFE